MKTMIAAVLATLAFATSVSAAPMYYRSGCADPGYISTHGVWDCR